MLPEEIRKKVHLIEITTRRAVDEVVSGNYRSHFKGHGMQFSEHRVYVPGDDVRHIDWKVSARTADTMIKKFEEERELTVMILVDVSGSGAFGSKEKLKNEAQAELAAMLAWAAIHTGDKVGVLFFAGEVEKILPPKKGRQHVLRIVQEILTFRPKTKGTRIRAALEAAGNVMKHAGVIFILSDFITADQEVFDSDLRRLSRKHDVIAIRVGDLREEQFPASGYLLVTDPETGEEAFVDTSSYAFQQWLMKRKIETDARIDSTFKGSKVERIDVKTQEDYAEAVARFFSARARRRR